MSNQPSPRPAARAETVFLEGGAAVLELAVGIHDCALLADHLPVAMVWQDSKRLNHQHYVRAFDVAPFSEALGNTRLHVPQTAAEGTLVDACTPLLILLADGRYNVAYEPEIDLHHGGPDRTSYLAWSGKHHVQSDGGLLLSTRAGELLDADRVQAYARAIRRGATPPLVIFGAEGTEASFLVDGHHKLEAYRLLRTPPPAIVLTAETPRLLTADDGCELLAMANQHAADIAAAHYRTMRGDVARVA